MIKEEKSRFLQILCRSAIETDAIVRTLNSVKLEVIIPEAVRNAMATGKAHFDKSNKIKGDFSPNIRIVGENGIEAQATLRPSFDPQTITGSLANLSYMMMLEQVLDTLQEIDTKVSKIAIGQKTDRFSKVIGAFLSYYNRLSEYKSIEEKRNAATMALNEMDQGLVSIHSALDIDYQELSNAPKNGWEDFWKSFNPLKLDIFKKRDAFVYRMKYAQFISDISSYYKFILLKDVVQLSIGDSVPTIENGNHIPFEKLCNRFSTKDFIKRMSYIKNLDANELFLLSKHSHDDRVMLVQPTSKIIIPLEEKDIKLIQQEYETRND